MKERTMADKSADGRKYDSGKRRWDLLPYKSIGCVVDVLTYGAKKYDPNNWQKVPDAKNRYFAAAMRHITAWWEGEKFDPESGIHHLGHAMCNLIFLMWFDLKRKGK
jgi:hypothetical protein